MNPSMQNMLKQLIADGLVTCANASLQVLTGGVSSEIYLVKDGSNQFVVKRALPKLKVQADWFADVSRNESEFEYIEYVSRIAPGSVPLVLKKGDGYFAMEYLGDGFGNWKQELLEGNWKKEHAERAAALLAKVHAASRGDATAAARFDNGKNFWELRIEPYLIAAGGRHPELKALFEDETTRLGSVKECLIHGDFSPKNILISGTRLVALDCEVANYGDPSFDYCFLLTHLLLKALWHSPKGRGLRPLVHGFMETYRTSATFDRDEARKFSLRGGRLLAMLLLARVDGKSPVEYLTDESHIQRVRRFACRAIKDENLSVDGLVDQWFAELS